MRFPLGKVLVTSGANAYLCGDQYIKLLRRHAKGDCGDLGEEDRRMNNEAIDTGYRILSMYRIDGQKIYIITEYDRSYTTIMLAEEY